MNKKRKISLENFGFKFYPGLGHCWHVSKRKGGTTGLTSCLDAGIVSLYKNSYTSSQVCTIVCADEDRFNFKNPKEIFPWEEFIYADEVRASYYLFQKVVRLLLFSGCCMAVVYSTTFLILLLPLYLLYSLFSYRSWKKFFYNKKILIRFIDKIDKDIKYLSNKYTSAYLSIPQEILSTIYCKDIVRTLVEELLRTEDIAEKRDLLCISSPETRSLRSRRKTYTLNLILYLFYEKQNAEAFINKQSKSLLKNIFGDVFD